MGWSLIGPAEPPSGPLVPNLDGKIYIVFFRVPGAKAMNLNAESSGDKGIKGIFLVSPLPKASPPL